MNVYVACAVKEGKRWLRNPDMFFDGRLLLEAGSDTVKMGISAKVFKPGMKTVVKVKLLKDMLDRHRVLWANLVDSRSCVRVIAGKSIEFFMMSGQLVGPLPMSIARRMNGVWCARPAGTMVRYGG